MGKIEDVIFANYRQAMEAGNMAQAKLAIELARQLKEKIELHGFEDFDHEPKVAQQSTGYFFNPLPYKYNPEAGLVELPNGAISLTKAENRLFYLFSLNESQGAQINIIGKKQISSHLWGHEHASKSAIKISIFRLRSKIEADPKNPTVIVNFNNKGYVFLGKQVSS